jgi:phage terminase small subunit
MAKKKPKPEKLEIIVVEPTEQKNREHRGVGEDDLADPTKEQQDFDDALAACNDGQKAFVLEYMKDFNASQACIRAGYSKNTSHFYGNRMMQSEKVYLAIARAFKIRKKELFALVDAKYVINGLQEVFNRAMQAVPALDAEGKPIGVFKMDNMAALRALELLGRYLEMFEEKPTEQSLANFGMAKRNLTNKIHAYLGQRKAGNDEQKGNKGTARKSKNP